MALAYSRRPHDFARALDACRVLLRAAYLGTLLAAMSAGCDKVVLTLIGGGAFENPPPMIWSAILEAIDEVSGLASRPLRVVVNGHRLGQFIAVEELLPDLRARGGMLIRFAPGEARVLR